MANAPDSPACFHAFADERRGRPFEDVRLAWLEGLREAGRHTDWQIRQAADAVSIYRHRFRRAGERTADGVSGTPEGSGAKGTVAHGVSAEMETALKLRHYSARTIDCLVFVRSGKGDKDRTTLLPESLHVLQPNVSGVGRREATYPPPLGSTRSLRVFPQ